MAEPGDSSRTDVRHPLGKKDLVSFEEVVNDERMEFELENRGKYRVHEVYCEDPKCSCGGASTSIQRF
ncbi:hypothetical protein AKJ57_02130 [candidate division MSBL1 archaeon SCGC-AAA259A05]|uniref:Uncharacterized protein n=1 Tax=candidate division MSBL1 archaeon SCGC-AAA259A05 TaxID=1698259 RepID=A0A133UAI8_9EURY|nr:hypothetical protein AKJ57_02130 [candidate division MSBL1 archaeon SCGC-AAA259A05]